MLILQHYFAIKCWTWKELMDIGKKIFKKFPEKLKQISGNFRTHNPVHSNALKMPTFVMLAAWPPYPLKSIRLYEFKWSK